MKTIVLPHRKHSNGLAQGERQGLERAFGLVVIILALEDVNVHGESPLGSRDRIRIRIRMD